MLRSSALDQFRACERLVRPAWNSPLKYRPAGSTCNHEHRSPPLIGPVAMLLHYGRPPVGMDVVDGQVGADETIDL